MTTHLTDAWRTIVPGRDNPHGPLPPLLVILSVVTGLVDAFSYLALGHVFVANMTGNVVFLSFALGGAPGFIWWASLLAILTFVVGAFAGGRIITRCDHRAQQLFYATALQTVLVAAACTITVIATQPPPHTAYAGGTLVALIVLLGMAMGLQNSIARALKVPDLTTTVLTLTITGIGADSRPAGGQGSKIGRRAVAILAMFVGGLVGALLLRAGHNTLVMAITIVLLLMVAATVGRHLRNDAAWTKP